VRESVILAVAFFLFLVIMMCYLLTMKSPRLARNVQNIANTNEVFKILQDDFLSLTKEETKTEVPVRKPSKKLKKVAITTLAIDMAAIATVPKFFKKQRSVSVQSVTEACDKITGEAILNIVLYCVNLMVSMIDCNSCIWCFLLVSASSP